MKKVTLFKRISLLLVSSILISSILAGGPLGKPLTVKAAEQTLTEAKKISEIFPDPNLAEEVAARLGNGYDVDSEVDQATLDGVMAAEGSWWQLSDKEISSLEGFQYLRYTDSANFYLYLNDNQISDITPLVHLSLGNLYLNNNNISNISALSGLSSLTCLALSGNDISDISVLSSLTGLGYLYLKDNNISDISALSGLPYLMTLELSDNNISNINGLSSLTNLERLDLCSNNISDISALNNMGALKYLYLNSNSISDISVLSSLGDLNVLDLGSNDISDISGLSGLGSLSTLNLGGNNISDISGLSSLTNLGSLDLSSNNISDFSPIAGIMSQLASYNNDNQSSLPQKQSQAWEPTTSEELFQYGLRGESPEYQYTGQMPLEMISVVQGFKCLDVMEAVAGEDTLLRTYNIFPNNSTYDNYITKTNEKVRITLTIPEKGRIQGSTYYMICVTRDGIPYVLKDLDKVDETITFETEYFHAFVLVRKDAVK